MLEMNRTELTQKQNVELLAPAGSYEALVAAVNAGADAVYIGGNKFGARAYADNLQTNELLLQAIDYAHIHHCALYLTVNTLLKENELAEELYSYLAPLYERGLDAVIVQDIGVLQFVRKNFPLLPVHASTQMTITGREGAAFLEQLGVSRIVTARELSLAEIKEIHNHTALEIESFVHGALCYCYSGQCLFSSLLGGRSGNRGRCAQPCRLPYQTMQEKKRINKIEAEEYPLSLKDLNTIDILPDIIEAGVYSLKIEGRMKKPEYTAGVVRLYRKYIDFYQEKGKDFYQVDREDKKELIDLYSRSGGTAGYYLTQNGKEMVSLKSPSYQTAKDELFQSLRKEYVECEKKKLISGRLVLEKDKPAYLEITLIEDKLTVSMEGEVVQAAQKQPVSMERIQKQLRKTGGTPFQFEKLDIDAQSCIFISVQGLNELRRRTLEELEMAYLKPFFRENQTEKQHTCMEKEFESPAWPPQIHTSIENIRYLPLVLEQDEVHTVYIDCTALTEEFSKQTEELNKYAEQCHEFQKRCYFILPAIFRLETSEKFKKYFSDLQNSKLDGYVIRNYESYEWLKQLGITKPIITEHNVYTFNREALSFWQKHSVFCDTAPLELNERELAKRGVKNSALLVYGYIPMMVTAQCLQKTFKGCSKRESVYYLKDRYQKEFAVKNQCSYCYNVIYNSLPMIIFDKVKSIKKLNPKVIRLHFSIENKQEAERILKSCIDYIVKGENSALPLKEYTRGHFSRGIE